MGTLSKNKRRAYQLRQKDTGWGRVAAHLLIPFYPYYYAISRRTITPFLYASVIWLISLVPILIIAGLLGLLSLEPTTGWGKMVADWAAMAPGLIMLAASTIGVKLGINSARKHARLILEADGCNQEPRP